MVRLVGSVERLWKEISGNGHVLKHATTCFYGPYMRASSHTLDPWGYEAIISRTSFSPYGQDKITEHGISVELPVTLGYGRRRQVREQRQLVIINVLEKLLTTIAARRARVASLLYLCRVA